MNITVETIERMILEELEAVLSEDEICAAGKNYVDGKKIGKKLLSEIRTVLLKTGLLVRRRLLLNIA